MMAVKKQINFSANILPLAYAAFAFPCTSSNDLGSCISDIYTWSLSIVGIIAFVQIVFAGVLYLTAAGNATRVSEAKSKISNAILGIIILFSSYLILNTINPDLVGGSFNLPDFSSSETTDIYYDAPPDDRTKCGNIDQSCCKSSPLCNPTANLSCQGSICKENIALPGNCGNGILDPGEECDGGKFAGDQTCQTRGFGGGSLSCNNCSIDTSTCNAGTCTPGIDCPPPGNDCIEDVDCSENLPVCNNGYCVIGLPPPSTCTDNSQCPADKPVCDNGVCKVKPVPGTGLLGEMVPNSGVVRKEGNVYTTVIGISVSEDYDNAITGPNGGRRNLHGWCPKLTSDPSPFTLISKWPDGVCGTNEPGVFYLISSQNINNFKNPFTFTLSSPDNSRSQTFKKTFDIQIANVCPQYWFTSCSSSTPNFSETICANTTFFCVNHNNSGFKYYPSFQVPTCNLANQCTTATYPSSYNFETAYCYNNQWKFRSELVGTGACGL